MATDKKTKDYTRRAVDKYNAKYDRILVYMPAGSKEKLSALHPDKSPGAVIRDLACDYISKNGQK